MDQHLLAKNTHQLDASARLDVAIFREQGFDAVRRHERI
jgi:hypothetical protein